MKKNSRGSFKQVFNKYAKFRPNVRNRPLGSTTSGIRDLNENHNDIREFDDVFTTAVELGCPFDAWKLYFYDKSELNAQ